MLQPLEDQVESKFVGLEDPETRPLGAIVSEKTEVTASVLGASVSAAAEDVTAESAGDSDHLPPKKRHKRMSSGASAISKELSADQKAIVKMNVTREATTDGFVKCCYCDKEITSKNVDRWASHLRGCLKTPEEVKAQVQPFRPTQAAIPGATSGATPMASVPGGLSSSVPPLGLHPGATGSSVPSAMGSGLSSTGQLVAASLGGMSSSLTSGYNEVFKVHVSKDYMKFNAAHFIAYKGFREKLHGHNYRVAVTITGSVGPDGYVVDFGEIKKIARVICKDLNETFLVPMNSDALTISFDGTNVHIATEDNSKFSFPKGDCSLLPIIHSSAEELAIFISNQLIDAFTMVALIERGVRKLEVSISEAHMQMASYERSILPGP